MNKRINKTSNIYRFNGIDPFDNWTVKDNCLIGYYPRNSIINGLSQSNSVLVSKDTMMIPNTVFSIKGSCFKSNKRFKRIFIPKTVKSISRNAFSNCNATLIVTTNSYAEKYAKKYNLKYTSKNI